MRQARRSCGWSACSARKAWSSSRKAWLRAQAIMHVWSIVSAKGRVQAI